MTRADRRRGVAALAAALCGATVLAGCTSGATPAAAPGSAAAARTSYVALGDSFTAAPFVPVTDVADGCFRSSGNYPALLAAKLDASLVDVSCSGADTSSVRGRQSFPFGDGTVAPQIDAVTRGTDLVTVGIGGNDGNLFAALVGACADPTGAAPGPCAGRVRARLGDPARVLARIGRRVTGVLRAVHRAAPDATVVLVGYPRLVARSRSCRAMPVPRRDRVELASLERRLARTLKRAARTGGAEYADMYALSRGHQICSADPWVNGRRTDRTRALAFHPFAEEQQAVADAVADAVAGLLS